MEIPIHLAGGFHLILLPFSVHQKSINGSTSNMKPREEIHAVMGFFMKKNDYGSKLKYLFTIILCLSFDNILKTSSIPISNSYQMKMDCSASFEDPTVQLQSVLTDDREWKFNKVYSKCLVLLRDMKSREKFCQLPMFVCV